MAKKRQKATRSEGANALIDPLESALAHIGDAAAVLEGVAKSIPALVYGHEERFPADRRIRLVGGRAEVPKDTSLYPDGVKVTLSTAAWAVDMLRQVQNRARQLKDDIQDAAKRLDGAA